MVGGPATKDETAKSSPSDPYAATVQSPDFMISSPLVGGLEVTNDKVATFSKRMFEDHINTKVLGLHDSPIKYLESRRKDPQQPSSSISSGEKALL